MGLPARLGKWMAAFLIDRQQSVKIGDTVSNMGYPNGGVPQGILSSPDNCWFKPANTMAHIQNDYADDSTVFDVYYNTSGPML